MESNFCKIATPISNLFNNKKSADLIQINSDCLECRDSSIKDKYKFQELFHCELQPIHFFDENKIKYLKEIKSTKPDLKLISFHLASCYENPKIKNGKFFPNGSKISENQLFSNAEVNFSIIKKIFGENIKIAVENNNHYNTEAYDYITKPNFIYKIVNDNDISFLYDTSHAKISAHNLNMNLDDYIDILPLNQIIQIHISRPGFDKNMNIFDKHYLPTKNELLEVISLTKRHPKIKYLTVEYYKNCNNLIKLLNQLRIMLKENYG